MSNGILPDMAYKCFLMFVVVVVFGTVLFFSRTSLKLFLPKKMRFKRVVVCGFVYILLSFSPFLVLGDPLRIFTL